MEVANVEAAIEALTDELASFNAVNGGAATTFGVVTDVLTLTVNGVAHAEVVDGVWTLTDAGKTAAFKGLTELTDAYDADSDAIDAYDDAIEALETAIGAVYKNENRDDVYSVFSVAGSYANAALLTVDGDGKALGVITDFTANASVFATKALADADAAGVKEVNTLTFVNTVADNDTVIYDGVTYTATGVVMVQQLQPQHFMLNTTLMRTLHLWLLTLQVKLLSPLLLRLLQPTLPLLCQAQVLVRLLLLKRPQASRLTLVQVLLLLPQPLQKL